MGPLLSALLGAPAAAELFTSPPTSSCTVGVYLLSLHHLAPTDHSFGADYWMWSDCDVEWTPLPGVKMVNGRKPDRGDEVSDPVERVPGRWWAYRKVSATFDHEWDMQRYPFDKHTLELTFEYTDDEAARFSLEPDTSGRSVDPTIRLDGWDVERETLTGWVYTYPTAFGDPLLTARPDPTDALYTPSTPRHPLAAPGAVYLFPTVFGDPVLRSALIGTRGTHSQYSRLTLSVPVERTGLGTFAKLVAGVISAVIVSQLSFRLDPRQTSLMSSRMSMVVGSLFAVVVNMRAVESVIGRSEVFTLVDKVHILALAHVVISAALGILSRRLVEDGREEAALKLDRIGFLAGFASFFGAVALLVAAPGDSG